PRGHVRRGAGRGAADSPGRAARRRGARGHDGDRRFQPDPQGLARAARRLPPALSVETGLEGKVALVAAASKGLGRAVAEALAAEGASLAICARGEAELKRTAEAITKRTGATVHTVAADVAQPEGIARIAGSTLERFGRVDVLVTNAGGPKVGLFETHDWSAWQSAVELTLRSAVELTRAVLPGMRERRWGRVIHVTSLVVKQPIDGLMLSTSIRAAVT